MHRQFLHTRCLSQQEPKWAVTNQLSGHGKAADSWLVTVHFDARLGEFFYWTRFIWNNVPFNNTTPIYL